MAGLAATLAACFPEEECWRLTESRLILTRELVRAGAGDNEGRQVRCSGKDGPGERRSHHDCLRECAAAKLLHLGGEHAVLHGPDVMEHFLGFAARLVRVRFVLQVPELLLKKMPELLEGFSLIASDGHEGGCVNLVEKRHVEFQEDV